MKKSNRIKKNKEIALVYQKRQVLSTKYFALYKYDNAYSFRIAISISKKYGNAVQRNLMKRRIRSIFYELLLYLINVDCVLVVKPEAKYLEFQTIKKEVVYLINKHSLLSKE